MQSDVHELLRSKLDEANYGKLALFDNPNLNEFVAEAIELVKPESVFVVSDSASDIARIRQLSVEGGEETPLALSGHTIHYDGYFDQGRDKANTRYLVAAGESLGERLNQVDKAEGLAEVRGYLDGIMRGRTMLVRFFCLGPVGGVFSISGVQLTDSAYVCHSEDLLYRAGYEQFKKVGASNDFFRVLHSAGKLENMVSADVDKRRIYIDLTGDTVYSINTQYAGNTVGFKKLSLRLAIRKAHREGWLAEHMFVMGAHGPGGRITYFTGAYPSACGKTSTAMIPGETIIGDDIAYLRRIDGAVHAVNVESGIFGIIRDVTAQDDPLIWKVLTNPGEVVFSNVLVNDATPYWLGDGRDKPNSGINHSGQWKEGDVDAAGNEIPLAHLNSRYCFRLSDLENLDERAEDPAGVPVGGVIYGGRDSDTTMPVTESFDWEHGVVTMGASLESETTAATLGKTGVRVFQPMANADFVSVPLGAYVQSYLDFVGDLKETPLVFSANYFIKDSAGDYITGMKDKYVWVKWMELRCHGEVEALETPVGRIPRFDDLAKLFKAVLDRDYTREEYEAAFSLRIPQYLAKIERITKIFREEVAETPDALFEILEAQKKRLMAAQADKGDCISPFEFE